MLTKIERQELSLDSVGRWWLDALEEGGIGACDAEGNLEPVGAFNPRGRKTWPTFVSKGNLHAHYLEHARRLGDRYPCTLAVFGKKLNTLAKLLDTRPTVIGKRVTGYGLPDLTRAREQFDEVLGHARAWGEQDLEQ